MWNCESLLSCRCMVCLVSVPWSKDCGCLPPLGTCAELVTSPHAFGSAVQGHKAQYYADNLVFCVQSLEVKVLIFLNKCSYLRIWRKMTVASKEVPSDHWHVAWELHLSGSKWALGTSQGLGVSFSDFQNLLVYWEMGSSTGVKDKQRGIVWLFNFVERMGLQEQHCWFSFFPLLVFSSLKPGLLGVVIQQLLLAAAIFRVRITGRNIIMCIRKDVVEKKCLSWESLSNGFLISKVTFRSLGWLCCMGKKSWRNTHEYLPFTDWGMQSV